MSRKRLMAMIFVGLASTLLPGIAAAVCDIGTPTQTITGFRNADLFVRSGTAVLVEVAEINGNIIVETGGKVRINHSSVNGSVEADEANGSLICIEGNSLIEGSVGLSKSNQTAAILIDGTDATLEVKGAVELDKSDEASCGGVLKVVKALIRSDIQATGACEATVTHTQLEGDYQATDSNLVKFEFNTTTSDVAADFGKKVYVRDNTAIGGDMEFVGFSTVRIERNGDVNGGITVGDNKNVKIADNIFNGSIESDADPSKVSGAAIKVLRNTLVGSLTVDSSEGAVAIVRLNNNQVLNGNLSVTGADDVRVIKNKVENGNLGVEEFVSCVARRNQVPKGNNLGCVSDDD